MYNKDEVCLLGILEAITKIERYTIDINNEDDLFQNDIVYDAVLMNFVVIGEMADRLSDALKSGYSDIEWIKIKGFRNIIAHNYLGIDAEAVWEIIKKELPILELRIKKMLTK